ncbi:hypothetical protein Bbelb_308460 [Branchiostoma belcheri]|nr:hypothetical protein Bbelb_308460 [Branchiostoma belcheri]
MATVDSRQPSPLPLATGTPCCRVDTWEDSRSSGRESLIKTASAAIKHVCALVSISTHVCTVRVRYRLHTTNISLIWLQPAGRCLQVDTGSTPVVQNLRENLAESVGEELLQPRREPALTAIDLTPSYFENLF